MFKNKIDINNNAFIDSEGKYYTFKKFHGNMSLVAFWAPWCKYCAKEFPIMSRLKDQLADKGYNIVPMVKNIETNNDINKFYSRHKIENMPTYITGDRELYAKLGVNGFPIFILVDEQGFAIARIRPNWHSGDILRLFDRLKDIIAMQGQGSSPNP